VRFSKLHITLFLLLAGGLCISFLPVVKKKTPTPVTLTLPPGWPPIRYLLDSNHLTQEGIALGRKLFYDGRLSKDGNFPCASCHQPFAAMANMEHNFSHGFRNQFTTRNAPSLANLAWQSAFDWDGGITHLDLQPLHPILATNEMAENLDSINLKLRKDTSYRRMFTEAFGSPLINTQRITKALSQFMLTLISANSKYDRVMAGKDSFNLPERLGYQFFKEKGCNTCHAEPLFTDFTYRNNGIMLDTTLNDVGRMMITHRSEDSLKFKVPSLRNVMITFPYMHDGRYYSVYDVLEHYNKTMQPGPTTDPLLKNKIPLSNFEKGQLVAFLQTLTDSSFLKNEKYTQPMYDHEHRTN
jgi:cytochrome c peroxidase